MPTERASELLDAIAWPSDLHAPIVNADEATKMELCERIERAWSNGPRAIAVSLEESELAALFANRSREHTEKIVALAMRTVSQ